MKLSQQQPSALNRDGSIAPLTCILMVFIVGMVAFAVDTSWLVLTRSELQNVADSAALAGANRLGDNFVVYSLPTTTTSNKAILIAGAVSTAKATAKTYAAANSAGAVSGLTLLDGDIDVGFTSSSGTYTSNASNNSLYPNTIKVTMRRDGAANGSLNMFFANVIGVSNVDVQATATALIYGGTVETLRTDRGSGGVLPVTFDVNHWNNFINTGKDADGNTTLDASGNPTIQIYPSIKYKGNFGYLSLDDSHVGASTMSDWIHKGVSASDIQSLLNNNLLPLSSHNSTSWDWSGENGFKGSNVMDINEHIGETFIIPLFTPKDAGTTTTTTTTTGKGKSSTTTTTTTTSPYEAGVGKGSNYDFNVVQLVGIKIMPPTDKNKQVVVQPVAITDPTMVLTPSSIAPIGTSSTTVTALAPPKLIN